MYVSSDVEAMSCVTLKTEELQFSKQTEPAKCVAANSTLGMTCSSRMCCHYGQHTLGLSQSYIRGLIQVVTETRLCVGYKKK